MSAPTEDFVSGRLRSSLNVIHRTDLRQTLRRKLFVLAGDFGFFRRNRISFMGVGQKRGRVTLPPQNVSLSELL
jgi:hypothetical protein